VEGTHIGNIDWFLCLQEIEGKCVATLDLQETFSGLGTLLIAVAPAYILIAKILLDRTFKQIDVTHRVVDQFHDIHSAGSSLKTKNDCVLWAVRFLDTASELVQIRRKIKVSREMVSVIERELGVARCVLAWAAEKSLGRRYGSDTASLWPEQASYLRSHPEIKPAGMDALPWTLRNFDGLDDGPSDTSGGTGGKPE